MKVLLVATVQSHIAQFHRPLANMLHEHGAEVHVAARDNLSEKNGLSLSFADKVFDVCFSRSPKSKDNIKAYKQLKQIIDDGNYDVVHCNTPMGGIIARLAARKARKKGTKVYYTAHGFHFYKGARIRNWILFYPIEKFFAKHYTDKLITITKEDYELASRKFKTDVRHMHGVGANSEKYYYMGACEKMNLRNDYGFSQDEKIILCVGELNKNKNQHTLINSFAELKKQIPESILLLAGNGPEDMNLRALAEKNNISDSVIFLGYTLDLNNYLNISDLAVSISFREGLPFNIIEAMLCKVPVVASHNRGHHDLIENGVNGILVSPTDLGEITAAMVSVLGDNKKREAMVNAAWERVGKYTDKSAEKKLEEIYFS